MNSIQVLPTTRKRKPCQPQQILCAPMINLLKYYCCTIIHHQQQKNHHKRASIRDTNTHIPNTHKHKEKYKPSIRRSRVERSQRLGSLFRNILFSCCCYLPESCCPSGSIKHTTPLCSFHPTFLSCMVVKLCLFTSLVSSLEQQAINL